MFLRALSQILAVRHVGAVRYNYSFQRTRYARR